MRLWDEAQGWRRDGAQDRQRRHPAGFALLVALPVLALLATACSSSEGSGSNANPSASARASAAAAAAEVRITPASGVTNADPSAGITVTAKSGTLKNVSVRTSGEAVPGSLSDGGRVWHSQWALDVSQSYTVTATESGGSRGTVTATSAFRTLPRAGHSPPKSSRAISRPTASACRSSSRSASRSPMRPGQRPARGGGGRAGREHLRQPLDRAGLDRERPARHGDRRELGRELARSRD